MIRITLLLLIQLCISPSLFSEITANYNGDKVEINWYPSLNTPVKHFIIERSKNGRYFKEIIKVECGKQSSNYYEVDYHPPAKKAFYRIKQFFSDGSFKYSRTIMVQNYLKINHCKKSLATFKEDNVLIIIRKENGEAQYLKADIYGDKKKLIGIPREIHFKEGKYFILSTSEDILLHKIIIIKNKEI